MRAYIIRRLLQFIPVLLGIMILVFALIELSPGDPSANFIGPRVTGAMREEIIERFGLNEPLHVRFISWMTAALQGDFGRSFQYRQPVMDVFRTMLGPTLWLSIYALIITLIIGIPAGIISATRQYSASDTTLTIVSLIGISMPTFFFALLLIRAFSITIPIFPMFGLADPTYTPANAFDWFTHRMWHLTLPAIVLGLASTANFMRYTRSAMLEVVKSDYIRTARAKGLKEKVVIYRHAFRNAVLPLITLLGFQIPALFGGAVLTETIFALPGIGRITVDAVGWRDYPIIQATAFIFAILTLVGMLVADILYAAADPRIRYD